MESSKFFFFRGSNDLINGGIWGENTLLITGRGPHLERLSGFKDAFLYDPKHVFSLVLLFICILFRCMSYFWCGGLTTTRYISQQCCSLTNRLELDLLHWFDGKVFVSSWDHGLYLMYQYIYFMYIQICELFAVYIYIYQKSHIYVYHTNMNNICSSRMPSCILWRYTTHSHHQEVFQPSPSRWIVIATRRCSVRCPGRWGGSGVINQMVPEKVRRPRNMNRLRPFFFVSDL